MRPAWKIYHAPVARENVKLFLRGQLFLVSVCAGFVLMVLQIEYIGHKKYLDEHVVEHTLIDQLKEKIVPKEDTSVLIENLVPKTQYTFNISAWFHDGFGPPNKLKTETGVEGKPVKSQLHDSVV